MLQGWKHGVVLAGTLALYACTAAENTGDQTSALLGAPTDPGDLFSVGVCSAVPNPSNSACDTAGARCTGTLIAPNLVLTARHCIDTMTYSLGAYCDGTFDDNIYPSPVITLNDSVLQGTPTWLPSSKTLVTSTNRICDDDVALIILKDSLPSSTVAPIPVDVDTDLATNKPSSVAIVGRGVPADQIDLDLGTEIYPAAGLLRRVLQNIPVLCVSDTDGTCSIEDYSTLPPGPFSLTKSLMLIGPSVTPGDSGSGILDQSSYTNGAPKLIAITTLSSFGADGKRNGGQGVRASSQQAFLVNGAQQAATAGGYPLPTWASGTASISDGGVAMDDAAAIDGIVTPAATLDAGAPSSSGRGCSMGASHGMQHGSGTLILLVGLLLVMRVAARPSM